MSSEGQPQTGTVPASATDLMSAVTTYITNAHNEGELAERITGTLVDREMKSRAERIVQGLDQLVKLQKAYTDINKPDGKVFAAVDGTGNYATSPTQTYSEKRVNEIQAAKKKIDKLTAALNKAISSAADFSDLDKLLKGGNTDSDD